MLAGWSLCWCGDRVFTKICMPPRRCLTSWPRSCMLPRRRLPSWRAGWRDGTAAGQRNFGRCAPGRGPADAPGNGLAGVSRSSPARILPGVFVFWFLSRLAGLWSSQRSACHHAGALESWFRRCRWCQSSQAQGWRPCWCLASCPGKAHDGAM